MPTYEYECAKCGMVFEHFQSIKAPKLTHCTQEGCRGKVTRLLGTGGGIIFKGGGFYETDYRSKDYKDKAKADSETGSKSDSKEGGKSESTSTDSKPKKTKKKSKSDS